SKSCAPLPLCFVQPYSRAIQSRCRRTCNVCGCRDNANDCAALLSYCLDPRYQPVFRTRTIQSRCRRTCNVCGCRDNANDCAAMVSYCLDPRYQPVFRSRCALTCGFC
ncbi:26 kDa secreted antigen, partial [Toxocara canis]